jgi:excisionase family DNA binding protein
MTIHIPAQIDGEALREIVREMVRDELAAGQLAFAQPESLLSVRHASERLDIPEATIRKWLQRGQINRYKIRGCLRVKLSELMRQ